MPPKKGDDRKGGEETLTRIAIVSADKCVQCFQFLDLMLDSLAFCWAGMCAVRRLTFTRVVTVAGASPRSADRNAGKAALW